MIILILRSKYIKYRVHCKGIITNKNFMMIGEYYVT